MSKSILLSIRPEWVAKILNGEKTIEIRKKFPKDYVGWVYIYCTKSELLQRHWQKVDGIGKFITYGRKAKEKDYDSPHTLNGEVVARFWCDKVEEIRIENGCFYNTDTNLEYAILEKSCLSLKEIGDYLGVYEYQKEIIKVGYAIHISKLEIFDEPRKLSEFEVYNKYANPYLDSPFKPLTKAPQNYCYVEGEE
jgi:predicted transcriptional regulator